MLFNPAHETYSHRHIGKAPDTHDVAGALFQCLSSCKPPARQAVETLLSVGAWTDAALTIVEMELPQWKMRRLVYDDGAWLCSLSKQPDLPADIDDTADGHHESAVLAILAAFIEARRRRANGVRPGTTPRVRASTDIPLCCDNFT